MSSDENPQDGDSAALGVRSGTITCGSTDRRRLLEQLGLEERIEFVGDALEAGRLAEEGDHRDTETGAGDESAGEDVDRYEETYL